MSDETILMLGKLIEDPNYGRDAIHIAVAPRIAAERLSPGQHVGLIGTDHAGRTGEPVGIVDPFLRAAVMKGERFFLFLYPATITSLRHEWTHPAFAQQAANAFNGGGEYAPKAEAEKWLRVFASEWGMQYQDMIDGASSGGGITARDRDIHSWSELEPGEEQQFWRHLETVTGQKFNSHHREETYFSCSC